MHAMLVFGPVHGLPRWFIFDRRSYTSDGRFRTTWLMITSAYSKPQGNLREQGTHTEGTHPHGTPSISSHTKTPRRPHAAGFYSANQRPRVT